MRMQNLLQMFFCAFLIFGCVTAELQKKPYIDELENMNEISRYFSEATNSANWKKLDSNQEVTFCTEDGVVGCTKDKVYLVTKYLPKKYLGYRYIVFKNDIGAEEIFSVGSLRKIEELKKLEAELERIDP